MTAIEETYQDVEQFIYKLTWDEVRKHGRDFNDVLSNAHEGFMQAYENFNPARSQFITCVGQYIRFAFLDAYNRPHGTTPKKAEFHRSILCIDRKDLVAITHSNRFDLEQFAHELSGDAQTVIQLVLDLPQVKYPVKLRPGLLRSLQRRLGWTAARCIETFIEIREAL